MCLSRSQFGKAAPTGVLGTHMLVIEATDVSQVIKTKDDTIALTYFGPTASIYAFKMGKNFVLFVLSSQWRTLIGWHGRHRSRPVAHSYYWMLWPTPKGQWHAL